MKIKVIASGSSGNCYVIDDGKTKLMIEAGLPINKIKKALNYKLHEIDAVLISHEHNDHAMAVKDLTALGIDVYMSFVTGLYLGLHPNEFYEAQEKFTNYIGSFNVTPFKTIHDCKDPLGFIVYSKVTKETLLFATDTAYIPYMFSDLNYIMIECNYDLDILNENVEKGLISQERKNRLLQSHFSLGHCKEFLLANDLSNVYAIYLLHLSNENSDAEKFKREISELTGKMVYIA